ncbi:MAG: cyclohexa-1,5-dienecarbonyl-CoA hydratase [Rhodocyclaceae bacterium]|jgi:cyclohexa-1,5-dienecarbonyl-CoA hydratase|nr:cyclohexa-1,5-dienecarbonyl-CoA hydratase [Rhodocyclaceae bacterium]
MSDSPIRSWLDRDGAVLRLRLARPKANVIDRAMMAALREALAAQAGGQGLKAVVLDHEGPHFSFGASIQEHMPDQLESMLTELHRLLRAILEYPVPVLMVVRGQCLGGGLELAGAGNLIFAATDAFFGQPEIQLAGFAPAASCILPERVGQARAEELLLSGRAISAADALRFGLVQDVSEDPEAAALAWVDTHLLPKSAIALRIALKGSHQVFARRVVERFAVVEKICMEELLPTHDMAEGMSAFLEKRQPAWRDC